MKKSILLLLLVLTFSCSKEEGDVNLTKEIRINITNDITYQYSFGFFDDDEGAEISDQAIHFEISEIVRSEESGYSLYKYKPQLNYVGEDYVEIISEKNIDSEVGKREITTIKLTFIVL